MILTAMQLFIQTNFFNNYYEMRNKNTLQKQIEEYGYLLDTKNDLSDFLHKNLQEDKLIISIPSSNAPVLGSKLNDIQNSFTIKTAKNEVYYVQSSFEYESLGLSEGDEIEVEGIGLDSENNHIFAIGIVNENGVSYYTSNNEFIESVEDNFQNQTIQFEFIKGKIIEINNNFDSSAMYMKKVASEWLIKYSSVSHFSFDGSKELSNDQYNYEEGDEFFYLDSVKNYILVKKYDDETMILGISRLTSISDLIEILNEFYLLLFLFILILSVIISFLFSKRLTYPILEMISYAKSIAHQQFQLEIQIDREDELGELGRSLKLISNNLQGKINNLKLTNRQLEDEINIQLELKKREKELVANIAHELKTPLTVIYGYIRGMKNGTYNKNNEEIFSKLLLEVDNMNDLIVSLLSLFKLQTRQNSLICSTFNLWEPILMCYDKLLYAYQEKGLVLDYTYDQEYYVHADYKKIEQVFNNLLINALNYSKVSTHVKLEVFKKESDVIFSISNTCDYMTEEDINQIWNPFYRVEKSRTKNSGGTGLGLSIVREILEIHGSKFFASYLEGNFTIRFSLKDAVN
jgi:signal transduction histidine kinase